MPTKGRRILAKAYVYNKYDSGMLVQISGFERVIFATGEGNARGRLKDRRRVKLDAGIWVLEDKERKVIKDN